jgi:hypothetical protein
MPILNRSKTETATQNSSASKVGQAMIRAAAAGGSKAPPGVCCIVGTGFPGLAAHAIITEIFLVIKRMETRQDVRSYHAA